MPPSAQQIIAHLGLEPLPDEGGLFKRVYTSPLTIPAGQLGTAHTEDKPAYSAIYYLLEASPDSFSALHRLPTDELYHVYLGDPVSLVLLWPDGRAETISLGQDVLNGQSVLFRVPANVWQGSWVNPGGPHGYALLGTTMAPAYTDSDFTLGERAALLAQYPHAEALITRLTR